jgi:hypothetical protein
MSAPLDTAPHTSDDPLPIIYDLHTDLIPDLEEARQFLRALDPDPVARFGLGTKDDGAKADIRLALRIYGNLERAVRLSGQRKGESGDTLAMLNWRIERGAGVFFSVQALDGGGAKTPNVIRVRGFYADADSDGQRQSLRRFIACSRLWPTMLVASGGLTASGKPKVQALWLVDDCPVDAFAAIQAQLLERTGTDPGARDLARIFRLPGFWHTKRRDAPRMARLLAVDGGHYTLADFTARMRAAPKQQEIRSASGSRSPRTGVGGASGTGTGAQRQSGWLRASIRMDDAGGDRRSGVARL